MLVLSRKVNEVIMVGGNVRITILGKRGSAIRVGIEAPLEVAVRRGEIDGRAPGVSCAGSRLGSTK